MGETMGIEEKITLKDSKNFINIEGHYGSYQNWLYTEKLKRKFWADRSCGLAAAGNVAYYLHKWHDKDLYSYNDLTITNFTLFLNELSRYIRPRIYGIPNILYMKKAFISFAKNKRVTIRANTINMRAPKGKIICFIKQALKENYPVMMVSWNSKIKNLSYHWVTVTGYFKDGRENNYIYISNWGRKQTINLDSWLDELTIYKGLVYFQ